MKLKHANIYDVKRNAVCFTDHICELFVLLCDYIERTCEY